MVQTADTDTLIVYNQYIKVINNNEIRLIAVLTPFVAYKWTH